MNLGWRRGTGGSNSPDRIGITAYGPNINNQRDPRFGRSSELPGEDPLLSGSYASEMVQGMQEEDAQGYPKVIAYLKHFTAYSRETNRGHDNYEISTHDLFESYLPQYEQAFREGQASGAMCSYNAINGAPSCANGYLLNDILRKRWGRTDAHVTTDCGAVHNLRGAPVNASSGALAASMSINNGSDIEMGSTVWTYNLSVAEASGATDEATIDAAFRRSYLPHFKAGRFDDPRLSDWFKLGYDDIASPRHQQIVAEAAQQGLVLLKHDQARSPLPMATTTRTTTTGTSPVTKSPTLAVVGPLAVETDLMSDYENDESCFGGGHDCVTTIGEAITALNQADPESVLVSKGVDVDSTNTSGIDAALAVVDQAEVVVLCLGITKEQEHEGIDRQDTALPGQQESFALKVLERAGDKPVVLVLVNGGQLAIDSLMDGPSDIIEAFNPNLSGANALALALYGENRWGKLPYTMYNHHYIQEVAMDSFDMSAGPGRTYRYYTGEPLFPFGHGLSYTTFQVHCIRSTAAEAAVAVALDFRCEIDNTGALDGDEVLMVFHSSGADIRSAASHPVPLKSLVDFERVRVEAGASVALNFSLPQKSLMEVDENGGRVLYPGSHFLVFTNGAGSSVNITVEV